jgi:hypothetical protein
MGRHLRHAAKTWISMPFPETVIASREIPAEGIDESKGVTAGNSVIG